MKVGIVMGSASDRKVMEAASDILKEFRVDYEVR
ncbi:MAG: AIR carboxylase family protein, partial [Muribaculaceae bacterium]|nr:AIR carboxylase family protein [Muribaculaceae bacterium]